MIIDYIISSIIILPLVMVFNSLIFGKLVSKKSKSSNCTHIYINTMLICISTILSVYIFFYFSKDIYIEYEVIFFKFINISNLNTNWGIRVDNLSILMFVVINTISSIVYIYSIGYMKDDKSINKFFFYISLFIFFMLLLVSSTDLIQMFVGWEGVGFCSYLLIGFWSSKLSANNAALKAFIVNRVGDFALLFGIISIYYICESVKFSDILTIIKATKLSGINQTYIDIIAISLFIGCMGKSAQIGLHTWLPDAMEGPTPVSALIHSATMVTAGIFLTIRLSPLFELSTNTKIIIMNVGATTAIFGAITATFQNDIKKVIAYSTCSQLGYMFVAIGFSAYNIALFHLFTHAFFKSMLFLCAGNIIHTLDGEQDMSKMGHLSNIIKSNYILNIIGSLSLIGIFPFSGYFSKDLIIETSLSIVYIYILLLVGVLFTAIYSTKFIICVYLSNPLSKTKSANRTHFHKLPNIMYYPLYFLAFFAIFGGIIGKYILKLPDQFTNIALLSNTINYTMPSIHEKHNLILVSIPLFVAVIGIIFSFSIKTKFLGNGINLINNAFYFNKIYNYIFVKLFYIKSEIYKKFESLIIENITSKLIEKYVSIVSIKISNINKGYIYQYSTMLLFGLVAILTFITCFLFVI